MTRPTNKLNVTVKNVVNLYKWRQQEEEKKSKMCEWNQFYNILDTCDILPSQNHTDCD